MTIQSKQETVSAEELIRRARDLVPFLRERADQVEKDRMVLKENIEALREAGLFKITQPAQWGGYEMDLEVFCQVLMEIGSGCPSTAWVLGVLGVHAWEIPRLGVRAGNDVWGENPDALIASSYSPFGTATKTEGGWILNGQWRSSSGCDHSDWAFIGAYQYDDEGKVVDHLSFLVPRTDYTIVDDWYTFGLQGTGSKSLVLDNVFVPDYRSHSMIEDKGLNLNDLPPLYRMNQNFVFFTSVSAAVVGFAQGAIDLYIEHMKSRINYKHAGSGVKRAAQSPYVKDRLGNAVLKVRSSRLRVLNAARVATEYAKRGEKTPIREAVQLLLDTTSVGKECSEAVILLHRAQSARGVYSSSPLQRVLRDILAAANHGTQNSDDTAGLLGGYLLGESIPPMIFNLEGYPPEAE